jgi:hypothetical protein
MCPRRTKSLSAEELDNSKRIFAHQDKRIKRRKLPLKVPLPSNLSKVPF